MRSTIICVDDDNWLLSVLGDLLTEWLGANYAVERALSGDEALEIIDECLSSGIDVSVVISDYIMPSMKGDELLEKVKLRDPSIRRIMLTGYSALEGVVNAINKAGIYRYLSKPWDNKDMMLTVLQAIRSYEQDKRAEKLTKSYEELYHKFESLANTLQINFQNSIASMSAAIEARLGETGHSVRAAQLSVVLGREAGLNEDILKNLYTATSLHNVGKMGLSDAEVAQMRGVLQAYSNSELLRKQAECAKSVLAFMSESDKLIPAIMYHMERYDGGGAFALAGENIPVEARIISIVNYYDLLQSARNEQDSPEFAINLMEANSGKIFDPGMFAVFKKKMLGLS